MEPRDMSIKVRLETIGVKRVLCNDTDSFDEQPLDMSVKRFKRGKSNESSTNKRRPSVIAFASNGFPKVTLKPAKRRTEIGSPYSADRSITITTTNGNGSASPPGSPSGVSPKKCSRTRVIIAEAKSSGETQSIIDEHFRRSLGADKFKDLFMKNGNTPGDEENAVIDAVNKKEDVNVKLEEEEASVDDHFAKALGSDYWLTLNKTIPKSSKTCEKSCDGNSPTPESPEEKKIPN